MNTKQIKNKMINTWVRFTQRDDVRFNERKQHDNTQTLSADGVKI